MFIIPFVIIASTFEVLIQAAPAPVPGRGGHHRGQGYGRGRGGQNQSVQGYGQSQWTQSDQSENNQGNFGSSVVPSFASTCWATGSTGPSCAVFFVQNGQFQQYSSDSSSMGGWHPTDRFGPQNSGLSSSGPMTAVNTFDKGGSRLSVCYFREKGQSGQTLSCYTKTGGSGWRSQDVGTSGGSSYGSSQQSVGDVRYMTSVAWNINGAPSYALLWSDTTGAIYQVVNSGGTWVYSGVLNARAPEDFHFAATARVNNNVLVMDIYNAQGGHWQSINGQSYTQSSSFAGGISLNAMAGGSSWDNTSDRMYSVNETGHITEHMLNGGSWVPGSGSDDRFGTSPTLGGLTTLTASIYWGSANYINVFYMVSLGNG
ncbi:hypothetical protein FRB93_003707 [Tulasnella sp. JGI-2019a]|nr:hypothetical protein FRB93_003707 [Tulasnella sp. JGI-2019a]